MNSAAVALIDNGSLSAEPHLLLRRIAQEISGATGIPVEAVSWKHSDRAFLPDKSRAPVLKTWVQGGRAEGVTDFIFIPCFISPEGAIAGSLRSDLEELGISYSFTDGLSPAVLGLIVAERVRAVIAAQRLTRPEVIVVDHGGPAPISGRVRNAVAAHAVRELGASVSRVVAASMETPETGDHPHNLPLFGTALQSIAAEAAIVAPLFLAPGRHAGPDGDLERIAKSGSGVPPLRPGDKAAERRFHGQNGRLFFADLIGPHPLVSATLAAALRTHISVPA
ncbi:MAG TPA: hypothetical protein VGL42_02710 [Opitutaceae bacterium]|jgi:sirohydrochlorin ferrochelatase